MLTGGTLTQLTASLGTPFAFDPPDGLRPLPRRSRRAALPARSPVHAAPPERGSRARLGARLRELPGCDEPDGKSPARQVIGELVNDFPGPVLYGLPSGHTSGATLTLPFGVRARVITARARARHRGTAVEERPGCLSETHSPHRHLRDGDGTLAALLKNKGYDVRGSDQNVYPPMSDFLVQQGITRFRATAPSTSPPTSISSSSATPSRAATRARGSARSQDPLLLAARSGPRSLPVGARSVVIAGTHGKTTTTSLTGWLLTHGGADPSVLIGGIAENFRRQLPHRRRPRVRDRGDEYDSAFFDKTAKFLKYLPDIAVVNNIEFDHADIYPDLDAIRLAFRRW
jgi:hypothetical protein